MYYCLQQERGIKVEGGPSNEAILEKLKSQSMNQPQEDKIYLDDENLLHWPVYFLYPEYNQSDFIEDYCESNRLVYDLVANVTLDIILIKISISPQL